MKKIITVGLLILSAITLTTRLVSAGTCTNLTKSFSKGAENGEVLRLQQFLFDSGYLTIKPNGYFGSGTLAAVKRFQGSNGLLQVGSVGPATRNKIKELSCVNNEIPKKVTTSTSTVSSSINQGVDVVAHSKVLLESRNLIPVSINDTPIVGEAYSKTFDFSKPKVEAGNYFISAFSLQTKKQDYALYNVYLALGNRNETGKASVLFTDITCEPGLEVRDVRSVDLCKKGAFSNGEMYIDSRKIGASKIALFLKGSGKISGNLIVAFPDNLTYRSPIVVLSKNITFTIPSEITATTTVSMLNKETSQVRNAQRQKDTRLIYTALVSGYIADKQGAIPGIITESPKEICSKTASSCAGMVDLSFLMPVYIAKLPSEDGKLNSNGIGYKISKQGDILTVSAQYSEGGETVMTRCDIKKPCPF
jgi:peptidoglycan hydrolase-like protein with peptidoglycan-binding domain